MKRSISSSLLALLALVAVVPMVLSAPVANAGKAGNTIHKIEVAEQPTRTEITVVAARRPTFTVFKLNKPMRLFIDIVDADLSKISPQLRVRNGVIADVAVAAQPQAGQRRVGRIEIAFDREASYDIETHGSRLVILIDGADRDRPDLKLEAAKAEAARLERVVARERKLLGELRSARLKEEQLKRDAMGERAQQEILTRRVAAARQQAERLGLQAKTELDRITSELKALGRRKKLAGERMAALGRAIVAEKERKLAALAERKKAEQLRRAIGRSVQTDRSRLAAVQAATRRAQAAKRASVAAAKATKARQDLVAQIASAKARGHKRQLTRLRGELARRTGALKRANKELNVRRRSVTEARLAEAQAATALRQAHKQRRSLEKEKRQLGDKRLAKERARVKALQQALAKNHRVRLVASVANERAQSALLRLERRLVEQRRAVKDARSKAEVEHARIAMLKSQLHNERKQLRKLRSLRASEEKRVAKLRAKAKRYEARAKAAQVRAAAYAKQIKRRATSKKANRVADAEIAQLKAKLNKERAAVASARDLAAAADRERARAEASRKTADVKRRAAVRDAKTADAKRAVAERKRRAADAKRAVAERKRRAADAKRAAAERKRKVADAGRAAAVRDRKAAIAARATAERDRKAAIAGRATAERGRKAAIAGRATAERDRKAANAGRVAAERDRKAANAGRVAAERKRKAAAAGRAAAERKHQDADDQRLAAQRAAKKADARARVAAAKAASSAAPPVPAAPRRKSNVRDVTFRADSGGDSEITIALDRSASYKVVRHSARRVELKLFGTTLPKALRRSLDASEFDSPIKLISSFPSTSEPGVTRVVIELREDATYELSTVGNNVVWAFAKKVSPSRVMAEAPPAPPVTRHRPGRRIPPGVRAYPGAVGAEGGSTAGGGGRSFGNRRTKNKRRRYTGKKINVTIKDADIRNVLTFLAKEGGVNIVASEKVGGKVTFHLENVPWDLALDMILKTQGYDYVLESGVYRVAPAKDIRDEFEAAIKKKEALRQLKPLVVRFISVNYANLKDLQKHIKSVLSKHGSVTIDQATSTVLVKDVEEHVQAAEEIVRRLDVQLPQVLIEARVVEASTSFSSEFGIQWGGDFAMAPAFGNPTGLAFPSIIGLSGGADDSSAPTEGLLTSNPNFAVNLPAAVGAGAGGALGLTLGSIGGAANLNLRLSAAESRGQVKIVSAPKILTLDGNKAIIQQGVSIPVPVVSANGVNTQFFDASLKLEVLTNTSPDGNIRLDIDIQKNEPDFGQTSANGAPTIQKKEAHTSLLVRDGETTVIGGIFTRNSGYNESGVPVLSKIPILGWFFKNHRESDNRSELLIFITPRILNRRASSVGQGQFSTGTKVE